jgi:hypothetical protein
MKTHISGRMQGVLYGYLGLLGTAWEPMDVWGYQGTSGDSRKTAGGLRGLSSSEVVEHSWGRLGTSGDLGVLLWTSWGPLGTFWGLRGYSCGPPWDLRHSWGLLGTSWAWNA